MKSRSKRRVAVAIAACVLPLAVLAAGELLARALGGAAQRFCVWEPGLELEFTPRAEIMPGLDGPSRFRANAFGFRGDELESNDSYRILCVGGSSSECLYLDQNETWPALLQASLSRERPTWVANAGRSGHSTREHVVQLEKLLADEPRY